MNSQNKQAFEDCLLYLYTLVLVCSYKSKLISEHTALSEIDKLLDTDNSLLKKYSGYFDYLYMELGNSLILDICNFFDTGNDCRGYQYMHDLVFLHFDDIFPQTHDYTVSDKTEFAEISRSELGAFLKSAKKEIDPIIEQMMDIRNKAGLAHGMPYDFSYNVDFQKMINCVQFMRFFITLLLQRYYNSDYIEKPFTTNTLKELYTEYNYLNAQKSHLF